MRALLVAALTTGADGFAHTGPEPEMFDNTYQGLRIVGSKPAGVTAPVVIFLPYALVSFDVSLLVFKPAMDKVAQMGYTAALVEYPDIMVYPDTAGEPFKNDKEKRDAAICTEWARRASLTADAIKNELCTMQGVDCSSIAVAGFSTGAGIATMLSTGSPPLGALKSSSELNIKAQFTLAWAPLLGGGQLGALLPQNYLPDCFVSQNPNELMPLSYGNPAMYMNLFLQPSKRFSVISQQDESFGNPPPGIDSASIFTLQQTYSGFCNGDGAKGDCIQPDGSGYYVVPTGEIAQVPNLSYHSSISANPTQGFFAEGGTEIWQYEAVFDWLLATAFGA